MHRHADIAIIGGGIVGMSCAYELARQSDLRIVLFDKQNPGSGTTGGSAGVICLHDMGELYAQLTLLGYARIQQLRHDYGFNYHPWARCRSSMNRRTFPASVAVSGALWERRARRHLSAGNP